MVGDNPAGQALGALVDNQRQALAASVVRDAIRECVLCDKMRRTRAFVRNIAVAAVGVEDECAILPAMLSPTFPPTTWIASPSGSELLVSTLPEMAPPLVTAAELTAALGTRLPWISFSRARRSRYERAFTEQFCQFTKLTQCCSSRIQGNP